MFKVYVYVLDTLADWEMGYVTAELNSGRYFKKDAPSVTLKAVSNSMETIRTMGGMSVTPDCLVDDIEISSSSVLLLPGANTWSDAGHGAVIKKAAELLDVGGTVCAICGATVALANAGLLNQRPHTSNGAGFLEMFSAQYSGTEFFVSEPSVADDNLITAGSTGALLWAKQIIERLDVFSAETLKCWYNYFRSGSSEDFFALMNTLPRDNNG